MSVVAFERKPCAGLWSETELNTMVAALNVAIASGNSRGWETGITETGDAQVYLVGPLPDQACEFNLSPLVGGSILQDGSDPRGFGDPQIAVIAVHAAAA